MDSRGHALVVLLLLTTASGASYLIYNCYIQRHGDSLLLTVCIIVFIHVQQCCNLHDLSLVCKLTFRLSSISHVLHLSQSVSPAWICGNKRNENDKGWLIHKSRGRGGDTLQDTLPPVFTARLIAPRVAGRALI